MSWCFDTPDLGNTTNLGTIPFKPRSFGITEPKTCIAPSPVATIGRATDMQNCAIPAAWGIGEDRRDGVGSCKNSVADARGIGEGKFALMMMQQLKPSNCIRESLAEAETSATTLPRGHQQSHLYENIWDIVFFFSNSIPTSVIQRRGSNSIA